MNEMSAADRLKKLKYHGQYGEMIRIADEQIDRLRTQLEMWQDGNIMADSHRAELAQRTAERDEARRALCMSEAIDRLHDAHPNEPISRCASIRIANEIAVDRGWDCFDAKEAK